MTLKASIKTLCLACATVWLADCGTDNRGAPPPPQSTPSARFASPTALPTTTPRPEQTPPYVVHEEARIPGIKLSLRVNLNSKVTEAQLRSIALKVRSSYPGDFQRVFITYFLPSTPPGQGAWATTHFNPSLEVAILGSTLQQEQSLRALPSPSGEHVLGSWFDDSPFAGGLLRLISNGGSLVMERRFPDGSVSNETVTERRWKGQRRFDKVDHPGGDFYTISKDGSLNVCDAEGVIKSIPPQS